MKKVTIALNFIILFVLIMPLHSSTDLTTSERILNDNKNFIEFINVSITNFASDKAEEYKKIFAKHFNADIAFLQGDYKRTYRNVYSSQGDMVKVFEYLVKNIYLEDSKNILDEIAPNIIKSKNSKARLYLTLGYRDRTISWTHFTVADATNPKLYSYKLYKYQEAIDKARRSKRYGFMALFESQSPDNKRNIYTQMLKSEIEKGNMFFSRFIGKSEQAYIDEMAKSYEESDSLPDNQKAAEGKEPQTDVNAADKQFEMKVEKRARFKHEKMAAEYLLNGEFDKASDIVHQYVEDYNYKLIQALFKTLAEKGAPGKEGEKGPDYTKYSVHLDDNYLKLTKPSVLESFYGTIKVEDSMDSEAKQPDPSKDQQADSKDSKESGLKDSKDDNKEQKGPADKPSGVK